LDPIVGEVAPEAPSRPRGLGAVFAEPAILHNEKRVILAFRFVVALVAFAFLFSLPPAVHVPWQFYFVVSLFLISNFVFFFEGIETFNTRRAQMYIFAFDIGMLTVLMIFLGLTNKEFYLVFFLTIFVSAISKRMVHALAISLVMSGLYVVFAVYGKTDVDFTSASFLVRVVLFFVVSSFVGHISEVAEQQKRHVEELTEWKEKMERLAVEQDKMAAVGLLAAGVSHEFNNLLAGIKGYADLARMGAVEQEELLEVVTAQCVQAAGIVRDLLAFSRKRGGDPEPQDVSEALEQVLRLVRKELAARDIRVDRVISQVQKVFVEPGTIERVALNLVQNALQAVESGGALRVSLWEQDDTVTFEIADDGRGMTPEVLAHAFEPFMTTKTAAPGGVAHASGLGLAVTKRLVEKCGGSIAIHSAPGRGTSVSVSLPAFVEEADEGDAPASAVMRAPLQSASGGAPRGGLAHA
jgi:signal transduction histidine kinase